MLFEIRKKLGLLNERTLDVQIIDVADEIAYAVHDLEDGLSLGYFNIDEITYQLQTDLGESAKEVVLFKQMVNDAKQLASQSTSYKTTQEYSQIFRRALVSKLTNRFIQDVGWVEVEDKQKKEHGTPNITHELGCCEWNRLVHKLKKLYIRQRQDTIQYDYTKREVVLLLMLCLKYTPIKKIINY